MRYQGKLSDWNDERGFGFVEPNGGGVRAFVHIKAFKRGGRRPVEGDVLVYELQKDGGGRPQARQVRFAAEGRRYQIRRGRSGAFNALLGLAFLALMGVSQKAPAVLLGAYGLLSFLTFLAYGRDKWAAKKGRWRTQENNLHLLALAGGWPGAACAQYLFRHKSQKAEFRGGYWLTVALNIAALCWLLFSAKGAALLERLA
ncbi:cold shock and DUF1294 domain-containing protein [Gallaecimonas kandeliae]|uniref:cold shock and DUF1294 domain-containing protein n=1 Tax=Gallaecimonas kandeliae TaxID=3029055 RepID=UPI0026470F3F|nr:cold shock and DUF1294 domain-containing protein [Gallaecimonas kandeliae]WKE64263.1 cold shock and DUF1294 domain-containing protein [Gallaecimonas kandeliae]